MTEETQVNNESASEGGKTTSPAELAHEVVNKYGRKYLNKKGNTLLHMFSGKNATYVYVLASRGVPVNIQNNEGNTPLHLAVMQDNFEIAQALLQCGADLSLRNKLGLTPFDILEESNILSDLLKKYQPGVVTAVLKGKHRSLERLCRNNWISFQSIVKKDKNVLQLAMEEAERNKNIMDCCRVLQDYRSTSEVVHAVLSENTKQLDDLIQNFRDFSVNVRLHDRLGKTLLSHAIESNNLEIVQMLVESGARVNNIRVREHDKENITVPLFHKSLRKDLDENIAKYLHSVQDPSELLEKDKNGNTAILRAIEERCSPELITWLLEVQSGRCLTDRNKDGLTPVELATELQHTELVQAINKFIFKYQNNLDLIQLPVHFYGKQNLELTDETTGNSLMNVVKASKNKENAVALQRYSDIEERGVTLFKAAANDNLGQVNKLNMANFQDKNGLTALHRAVVFNQRRIAENLILSRPVLKSIPDNCNRYPLHYTCLLPDEQLLSFAKLLLEKDPQDIEKKADKDGRYPVEYKSLRDSQEGLQILYDARTLDAFGNRSDEPLGPWPEDAETSPPDNE